MRFKVILYPSDEGCAVTVPSLPGCWSQGATADEAMRNIAEAIREYLGAVTESEDGGEIREVEVAV